MITAEWLKGKIEKREERIRNEGREEVLAILDEEARKDAERKLNLNGNPDSKN